MDVWGVGGPLLPNHTKTNTNPVNIGLQGVGGSVGAVWGGCCRRFGVVDMWEVHGAVVLPSRARMDTNPVNVGLQGIGGGMGAV